MLRQQEGDWFSGSKVTCLGRSGWDAQSGVKCRCGREVTPPYCEGRRSRCACELCVAVGLKCTYYTEVFGGGVSARTRGVRQCWHCWLIRGEGAQQRCIYRSVLIDREIDDPETIATDEFLEKL